MTGRGILAALTILLVTLFFSATASAHNLILPGHVQSIRDRPYHISEDLCGPAMTGEIERAVAIWNFYAPARLKRVTGPLPARDARYLSFTCQDGTYFADILGKATTLDGTAYWWYTDWQLRSVDIVFNTGFYEPRHCSRLHEIGHGLGLLHSEDPRAAMDDNVDCEYLAADDLVGIAAVFNVAPNCTPYVSEDFTVYFPNLGGDQVELRPILPANPAGGFYESDRRPSLSANWQCMLSQTASTIDGAFYHRGKVFRVHLDRVGNGWSVGSATPL